MATYQAKIRKFYGDPAGLLKITSGFEYSKYVAYERVGLSEK